VDEAEAEFIASLAKAMQEVKDAMAHYENGGPDGAAELYAATGHLLGMMQDA
jgi:hypothetical protein